MDVDWKKIVLPIMEHYTEATDGSSIEQKESALVWHHQEADPDFGSWQAKELLDHLESVLANDPVVVKTGQQIVEVKPQVRHWHSISVDDTYNMMHIHVGREQRHGGAESHRNHEEYRKASRLCFVHRRRQI